MDPGGDPVEKVIEAKGGPKSIKKGEDGKGALVLGKGALPFVGKGDFAKV